MDLGAGSYTVTTASSSFITAFASGFAFEGSLVTAGSSSFDSFSFGSWPFVAERGSSGTLATCSFGQLGLMGQCLV